MIPLPRSKPSYHCARLRRLLPIRAVALNTGRGPRCPGSGWRHFRLVRTPPAIGVSPRKAAGTPVEIANGAGGAAETLATLLPPLLAPVATARVAGIANLPLIELPAEHRGPFLAIVLSGDGGWRDVDKDVAEKLRSEGVSVVGWDSLRYFWRKNRRSRRRATSAP